MFGRKRKNPDPKTGVDYDKLGRAIEGELIKNYIYFLSSTRRQVFGAFIRGVMTGFGGVVGATVVVALFLFIIHLFGGVPVIGTYFQHIGQAFSTKK